MSGIYERSEVSHVLERAAYLELFLPNQGDECFEKSPVNLVLSAGEQEFLEDSRISFRLRFRRIVLALKLENCSIAREGRYEKTLTEDEVLILKDNLTNDETQSHRRYSGVASIELAHKILNLGIGIGRKRSATGSIQRNEQIQQRLKIKVVSKGSGPNWEVGHEVLGDPRQFDALLKGDYLNEASDLSGESIFSPLCLVEPIDIRSPYSVIVEARVRKHDCVYYPFGAETRNLNDWRERNKIAVEGALITKMLQTFNERGSERAPPGQIILARTRLNVRKATDV